MSGTLHACHHTALPSGAGHGSNTKSAEPSSSRREDPSSDRADHTSASSMTYTTSPRSSTPPVRSPSVPGRAESTGAPARRAPAATTGCHRHPHRPPTFPSGFQHQHPPPNPRPGRGARVRRELPDWRTIERVDHQCRTPTGVHRIHEAAAIRAQPRLGQIPRDDAPFDGNRHARTVPALIRWTACSVALAISSTPTTEGGAAMLRFTTMIRRRCGASRRLRVLHRLTTASAVESHGFGSLPQTPSSAVHARPTFTHTPIHTPIRRSIPCFPTHPYIAQQLIRDRQERLRHISQRTHLRHEARRIQGDNTIEDVISGLRPSTVTTLYGGRAMTPNQSPQQPDRNLALELVRVTESAALAASRWVGRGDKNGADKAAVDAMRTVLSTVPMDGIVVIGEGEKDEAPMLFNGEQRRRRHRAADRRRRRPDRRHHPDRLRPRQRHRSHRRQRAGHDVRPGPVRLHAQDRRRPRGRRLDRHHRHADAEPALDRQGQGRVASATSRSSSSTANGTPTSSPKFAPAARGSS